MGCTKISQILACDIFPLKILTKRLKLSQNITKNVCDIFLEKNITKGSKILQKSPICENLSQTGHPVCMHDIFPP